MQNNKDKLTTSCSTTSSDETLVHLCTRVSTTSAFNPCCEYSVMQVPKREASTSKNSTHTRNHCTQQTVERKARVCEIHTEAGNSQYDHSAAQRNCVSENGSNGVVRETRIKAKHNGTRGKLFAEPYSYVSKKKELSLAKIDSTELKNDSSSIMLKQNRGVSSFSLQTEYDKATSKVLDDLRKIRSQVRGNKNRRKSSFFPDRDEILIRDVEETSVLLVEPKTSRDLEKKRTSSGVNPNVDPDILTTVNRPLINTGISKEHDENRTRANSTINLEVRTAVNPYKWYDTGVSYLESTHEV